MKNIVHIDTEDINKPELQEFYPQLAPIKPFQYNYKNVEVILGQDYYHAVRPIEFLLGEDSYSPCSDRLPISWVISCPLLPSAELTSCFKCVLEDSSLTDQYELESYVAFKEVDARCSADKRALTFLNSESFHYGEIYIVTMLCADRKSQSP